MRHETRHTTHETATEVRVVGRFCSVVWALAAWYRVVNLAPPSAAVRLSVANKMC